MAFLHVLYKAYLFLDFSHSPTFLIQEKKKTGNTTEILIPLLSGTAAINNVVNL